MPLVKNFRFTLNTDADTFCTWFEDRNGMWVLDSATGATGGYVQIQKAERAQTWMSRTQFSFAAVIEISEESEEWSEAENRLFVPDWVERKGIYRANVISIMAMPGTHAGKVNIRALCWDYDAVDGFARIVNEIAKAYPEAETKIRELEDKRVVATDEYEPHILRGARKRGRPRGTEYDDAYQNILDGMDMETAFDKYLSTVELAMPGDWNNFRRAMNRRKKRSKRYE